MKKFLMTLAATAMLVTVSNADLVINEIRIDQPGGDDAEYFELFADGMSFADLSTYSYIVIGDGTGGSGTIEAVVGLSGSLSAGDFLLVAEGTFNLSGTPDITTSLNFENGDNVTHLLVQNFTGLNGDDLDTNDDGVLDSTPWGTLVDGVALVEELNPPAGTEFHYGDDLGLPIAGPDGTFVPGHVFRDVDGSAGTFQIGAFDPAGGDDTPGATNIPEPGTTGLIGLALFAASFVRRRG